MPRPPKLKRQTVVNVFVISRVPENGAPISYGELYESLERDIERSREQGFEFEKWSKLSLRAAVRFVIQRRFLTCIEAAAIIANRDPATLRGLQIYRNERTLRYLRRVPKRAKDLVDGLPASNLLVMLAGMAE